MSVLALALLAAGELPAMERVTVAPGRVIALRCVGSGEQTILFESGGSDWSLIWARVQPALGKVARSCSYDRAGLGESDPARGPRTPFAIADDLHTLISAAKLGKVILVGHSLGGFNAKLTAALFPADVSGLVLLDPSEDRTWARSRAFLSARFGIANAAQAELADQRFMGGLLDHYRRCAAKAAEGTIDLSTPDWRRCADPERPALGDVLNAERGRVHAKPTYQAAQASEIAWSVYGDSGADPVYAALFRPGMLGNKPMIVLTHQEAASDDPIDQLNAEQGLMLHRQSAALSRRGQHRVVANSGHYIQLDQPKLVVAAVEQVLAMIRNK